MDLNIDTYTFNGVDYTIIEIDAKKKQQIIDNEKHIAASYLKLLSTGIKNIYVRVLLNGTDNTYVYNEFVTLFNLTKFDFDEALKILHTCP